MAGCQGLTWLGVTFGISRGNLFTVIGVTAPALSNSNCTLISSQAPHNIWNDDDAAVPRMPYIVLVVVAAGICGMLLLFWVQRRRWGGWGWRNLHDEMREKQRRRNEMMMVSDVNVSESWDSNWFHMKAEGDEYSYRELFCEWTSTLYTCMHSAAWAVRRAYSSTRESNIQRTDLNNICTYTHAAVLTLVATLKRQGSTHAELRISVCLCQCWVPFSRISFALTCISGVWCAYCVIDFPPTRYNTNILDTRRREGDDVGRSDALPKCIQYFPHPQINTMNFASRHNRITLTNWTQTKLFHLFKVLENTWRIEHGHDLKPMQYVGNGGGVVVALRDTTWKTVVVCCVLCAVLLYALRFCGTGAH